jgi:hypothetical protein
MDAIVVRSMLKWPDVPDVYGWMRLDRRGRWRIKSARSPSSGAFEPIGNAALNEFIARNYAVDPRGCWFFQNGPQRVFIELAYTPFVFRLDGSGLADHCGRRVDRIEGAWLDEEGSLLLSASGKVGILDDRDLGAIANRLSEGVFPLGQAEYTLESITSRAVEDRFGFVRDPRATA